MYVDVTYHFGLHFNKWCLLLQSIDLKHKRSSVYCFNNALKDGFDMFWHRNRAYVCLVIFSGWGETVKHFLPPSRQERHWRHRGSPWICPEGLQHSAGAVSQGTQRKIPGRPIRKSKLENFQVHIKNAREYARRMSSESRPTPGCWTRFWGHVDPGSFYMFLHFIA